jgi:hypothetical protein
MRRNLLIFAALAAFVLIIASQALAVPKMFLPEEKFDFGYTPQNVKVTHTFWIKSVGDDTLKILKVVPG